MPRSVAEIIRDKLNAGVLPHDDGMKLWACGIGSGKACTACEQPILPSQAEYEIAYYDERPAIRFHVLCHSAWEAERKRPTIVSPSDASNTTTSDSSDRIHDQGRRSAVRIG